MRRGLDAVIERMPHGSVFSHLTAARLHGLEVAPTETIDVTVPADARLSARAGLHVHRARLDPTEVTRRSGLPVTSAVRTCLDLARGLPLADAVAVVDVALHLRLVLLDDVQGRLDRLVGSRGIRQARRVVELAEPRSESPMESRLRVILVGGRLPRPEAQVTLRDGHRFLGRADLHYPQARLCIEYDGGTHRDTLEADDLRQNRLVSAGYRLLRYTASDVYRHPERIVAQVRTLLKAR